MLKKIPLQKFFEISICRKLKISIWILPIILSAYFGGYAHLFFVAYLSAFLHELAHILCAKFLNVPIKDISIYPFGICAMLKSGYIQNSEKEFFIAFSGPFCSLILFWILRFLYSTFGQALFLYASDMNLALCLVNLIPAVPLDGGRILKSILTLRFGIIRAYNFMLKLSRVLVIVLLIFSLIFVLLNKNFSLILITAFLLQNLAFEKSAITQIALKEILRSKQKVSTYPPVKTLCVENNCLAIHILKQLSYDRFCIVNVLDSESKIVKTLTEAEVIDALCQSGIRIKYSEI